MSDQQALEDAARREVLELEAKIYADPMSRHNVGPLLAQEFWDVSPAGEKVTREAMLERLAANPVIVDEYPVDDTRVDVYGDVAISTGHAVLRGHLIQEGGDGKARSTAQLDSCTSGSETMAPGRRCTPRALPRLAAEHRG